MQGIPIGGVLSSAALAIVLGFQEHSWLQAPAALHEAAGFFLMYPVQKSVAWRRYADDAAVANYLLCGPCLVAFAQRAYNLRLSVASVS